MSRQILVPHSSGGLVDYKGESKSRFSIVAYESGVGFHMSYDGPSDSSVWADSSYVEVGPSRTMITGKELMARFDHRNPEIWGDIEEMTQTTAIAFRDHVGRRMNSLINLERASVANALDALEANTVATADDVTFIKTGIAP